jgi:hypothetical protein
MGEVFVLHKAVANKQIKATKFRNMFCLGREGSGVMLRNRGRFRNARFLA